MTNLYLIAIMKLRYGFISDFETIATNPPPPPGMYISIILKKGIYYENIELSVKNMYVVFNVYALKIPLRSSAMSSRLTQLMAVDIFLSSGLPRL